MRRGKLGVLVKTPVISIDKPLDQFEPELRTAHKTVVRVSCCFLMPHWSVNGVVSVGVQCPQPESLPHDGTGHTEISRYSELVIIENEAWLEFHPWIAIHDQQPLILMTPGSRIIAVVDYDHIQSQKE